MPMPRESIPLNDLIERGTISPALAKSIAQSLQANRKSLITGCPGSGKTTFLEALPPYIAATSL